MIKREKYLNELINSMNDKMPKVITGIRRCGKSIILNQVMSEIKKSKSNNIIYLNFEDKKVISNIYNACNNSKDLHPISKTQATNKKHKRLRTRSKRLFLTRK